MRYQHVLGTTDHLAVRGRVELRVVAYRSRTQREFYIHCFASFIAVKVITEKKPYRRSGSLDHAGFDE